MFSKKFEKAFLHVIKNEGGYVCNKNDPGGETKFGISRRSYPNIDIKNLTLDQAKEIYYKDFWRGRWYENIENEDISIKLFDLSVNVGIKRSIRLIQTALRAIGKNVQEDGIIGEESINNSDAKCLLAALKAEAAAYYRSIAHHNPSMRIFIHGWISRAYS